MIYLETTLEDEVALQDVVSQYGFEMPKIKISVYKNRRGQYKGLLIWCKDNRGTCKIDPLFITNYKYELINLEDIQINIVKEDNKKDIKNWGFK